jgi:hypothetical protein
MNNRAIMLTIIYLGKAQHYSVCHPRYRRTFVWELTRSGDTQPRCFGSAEIRLGINIQPSHRQTAIVGSPSWQERHARAWRSTFRLRLRCPAWVGSFVSQTAKSSLFEIRIKDRSPALVNCNRRADVSALLRSKFNYVRANWERHHLRRFVGR